MHRNLRVMVQSILIVAALSMSVSLRGDDIKWMRTPDVVYVGTPYDLISKMLQMAKVKKGDVVYDLGCGDGRMLILAAQKYGCHAIGYDIDPERVREARQNVIRNKVEKLVTIVQEDIFKVDLSNADVLPLYLLPEMNRKLIPQLEKLKPGSRLVFHDYDLSDFIADKTVEVISNEDNASHTLSLYTTPLKKK
jgi:ribosomal protein L11 methylase PrmA